MARIDDVLSIIFANETIQLCGRGIFTRKPAAHATFLDSGDENNSQSNQTLLIDNPDIVDQIEIVN